MVDAELRQLLSANDGSRHPDPRLWYPDIPEQRLRAQRAYDVMRVYRPGDDVHGDAAGERKRAAATGGQPVDPDRSRVTRTGNRLDPGNPQ